MFTYEKCPLLRYYAACSGRLRLKCDGIQAETRFHLSAKRTSPFKTAGASVQSNTGSRGVRISDSNAGYTMFRGSVKGTGYPPHSPVSPSLPLPCVTVCYHVSTGVYTLSNSAEARISHILRHGSLKSRVFILYLITFIILVGKKPWILSALITWQPNIMQHVFQHIHILLTIQEIINMITLSVQIYFKVK